MLERIYVIPNRETNSCICSGEAGDENGPAQEGTGMGDGSTKGAKDVSDEIDNEDQLLGTDKDKQDDGDNEDTMDNDAKGEPLDNQNIGCQTQCCTH